MSCLIALVCFLCPLALYPSVAKERRSSSYPYLSGDTWRFFCNWQLGDHQAFDPALVLQGDTIFVEYDSLTEFATHYLPYIAGPILLITPNCENGSDNPLPGAYRYLLESEKIAAWFLQNIDCAPSSRLIPIPIGLANRFFEWGNIDLLDTFIARAKPAQERAFLVYVNFAVSTNPSERQSCLEHFRYIRGTKIRGAAGPSKKQKPFLDYLHDLSQSVFVASPPGNGLDCHRTWEALLMGCYPIVKSSTLDPLFEHLPVVIVKDWRDATESLLHKKKREFSNKQWPREKLYAPYWFQQVLEIQDRLRKESMRFVQYSMESFSREKLF